MVEVFPRVSTSRYCTDEVTDEAIDYIAANLRPADAAEVFATAGHTRYADAIRLSLAGADDAVVVINAYGEPVAVIGVGLVSLLYNTGCPWMLATPGLMRHKRAFMSLGRAYTTAMLARYEVLTNHVDQRNKQSVAWLQHLGYKMSEPEAYGALGLPFHEFQIAR